MHERTTRAIAQWMFVVCCALPTLITFLVVLTTKTPWYHNRCIAEVERDLGLRMGMRVSIGDLERSSPSKWLLGSVSLHDPETDGEIAKVRNVCWIQEDDATVIRLSQPEIQTRRLASVLRLMHDGFLCRPSHNRGRVRLAIDDLTLRGDSGSQTWRDVDAWLEPRPDSTEVTITCLPAGEAVDREGLQIQVTRARSPQGRQTIIAMQTGELRLPVSVFADYFPGLKRLGPTADYFGSLTAVCHDEGSRRRWTWDLGGGQVGQIDLGHLTQDLPHRLTGRGNLNLVRCQVDGSGAVNISGDLVCQGGWMAASLLPRLAEDLNCELTTAIDQDFQYDVLAMRLDFYASQMRVQGIAGTLDQHRSLPAGVVISSGGRPLAYSRDAWLPSTQLARLVAPPHSVEVPLSRQTSGLLWILRAPSNASPDQLQSQQDTGQLNAVGPVPEPSARIGRLLQQAPTTDRISQPLR